MVLSTRVHLIVICCFVISSSNANADGPKQQTSGPEPGEPRIVNIINFIRLLEPRSAEITEEVLYQTVVEQIRTMRANKLKGTFLLQYDALMDPRYQKLLTSVPPDTFEVGAWWEIPQPLVERAGMKWRGRYPWDWYANVGFSTGYTPQEREKLVDVYMEDFKKIFGRYPASVGSWFIDAHTLNYMSDKYHITASCNCKDQYGTDGYTLWGGYWSGAYYPSRLNSYMPAQHEERQLPVPIFRMLGSDPVRQYDQNLTPNGQSVVTLEPVYQFGGGDSSWVHWYFRQFLESVSLGYNYVQTGQENSFTWDAMAKGFSIQLPLIARLRDEKKIRVETLGESGKWFRQRYALTPATSVTVNRDLEGSDKKTAWFNSRFYRVNLLWEHGQLRIRDIHLFDERLPSFYTTGKATSNDCAFFALPFVEGRLWSSNGKPAGMQVKALVGGKEVVLEGGDPEFSEPDPGVLRASWPLRTFSGRVVIEMDEKRIRIELQSPETVGWFLDLRAAESAKLPYTKISKPRAGCRFEGMSYFVGTERGSFEGSAGSGKLRILPEGKQIVLNLAERE